LPWAALKDAGCSVPRPAGTLTFLLTDIEGSTRLWEAEPEAMEVALQRHDRLLGEVIEEHGRNGPPMSSRPQHRYRANASTR
jgi:class 3 adenylate cyclase